MSEQILDEYDVVVVGGGPAGLNGAMMLGRSRRSVLVVDAGDPRNATADAVHGLLGHDGTPPAELRERGRAEVRRYGGHLVDGAATGAARLDDGFVVSIEGGRTVRARRLLVTTGLADELPDVPGLSERWGRDVLHCPYCHGWEVRDRAIGVLGTGPTSVHQALLFSQLSDDVVLVTHAAPPLDDEQAGLVAARGVRVVSGEVTGVEVADDRLTGLRLSDGTLVEREVVAVATRMVARAGFLGDLGLHPVEHPSGMGVHLPAEPVTGRTDVPGVWAAGNVVDLSAQVGASAAAGAMAGAHINADLVMADAARPVSRR
ncbi:NAD(P)/FAD-dependent oxidoreductase [Nocardioides sp. GXQ0305]|uniref:NAD(P)/FAD-dependent oxidoreductase n=1 Tax=Nocardioides sp. GXQ0305 TaxID=3423912 RepID=UPI003D7C8A42